MSADQASTACKENQIVLVGFHKNKDEAQKYEKKCLFLRKYKRQGLNIRIMEADTLTRIDTTAQLNGTAYSDSTALLLNKWNYSGDAAPLLNTKFWLQDSILFSYERHSQYYTRHEGIARSGRIISESLLLLLLLLELMLVAYLIKNGVKIINKTIRGSLISEDKNLYSEESVQEGFRYRQYLWVLSIVVFTLMIPAIVNIHNLQINYDLSSWQFFRSFLYVFFYFLIKNAIYRIIGNTFFSPVQTELWISGSKTILSFYALSLTPILIFPGVGLTMQGAFVPVWVVGFLIIAKIWQLVKVIDIFSIGIGSFLYLILYLCALEFMPVLLFYKGLFLL